MILRHDKSVGSLSICSISNCYGSRLRRKLTTLTAKTTGRDVLHCQTYRSPRNVCAKIVMNKVATDTKILDLRTRYRTKLGWFFWFWPIQRYNTTKGKWQIVYLRTRFRTKLGWFFWFGPILETIRRNLACVWLEVQCQFSPPPFMCQLSKSECV